MKLYKYLFAVTAVVAAFATTTITAKNKCMPKVYAFGFAASFNDSTVYFTDIQEIDSVWINDKTKFMLERENYSGQLKTYLNGNGKEHRTCVISYAFKRKDIDNKYRKMRDRYVKRGGCIIEHIAADDFRFQNIVPQAVEDGAGK